MLAVAYLVVMVAFGDTLASRFFSSVSRVQRLAAAFLVGLLVSTWLTYLAAASFGASMNQPLLAGDALLLAGMSFVVALRVALAWRRRGVGAARMARSRWVPARGPATWSWIVLGALTLLVTWMMTSTLGFSDGKVLLGGHEWGDFGPTMAIAQSFAVGHNFPTQYPLFAGEPILYHFLFYFQVGNLTFLGLDPATANNVLSIGSMVAMLGLVIALGERLFGSPATGRIAAILFFFHGSLSFVRYLGSFASPADAVNATLGLTTYLGSGLPYRGEDWATWTQNVYLNQRHLASAIGIVLLALVFVVDRLQARAPEPASARLIDRDQIRSRVPAGRLVSEVRDRLTHPVAHVRAGLADSALPGYLATGLLLGLLPLWNSPMFVASAVLFAIIFVVFANRVQMAVLAIAAAIPAIPQVLFLRPPGLPGTNHFPIFHWGYTVDPPTLLNVAIFLGFIFGPKLFLAAVALIAANSLQRRIFLAACGILGIAFLLQLTVDIVANHKFLNAWLVIVNVFAAYGVVRLWRARPKIGRASSTGRAMQLVGRLVAVAIVVGIVTEGIIDLMPVKNDGHAAYELAGDPLYDWVIKDTKPTDVFLTDLYIASPILLAGRAIYFGWPVYAWSAGYDVDARQAIYVRMFSDRSPRQLVTLLQQNHIAYVAIDDPLRRGSGDMVKHVNEDVYQANFEQVFADRAKQYEGLAIYKVPTDPTAALALPDPTPEPSPTPPPVTMSTGGRGSGAGQFLDPRGIAVGPGGDVLVADSGNDRIQRFAADGTFRSSLGASGTGTGQLDEPNGVAVTSTGHVFVADTVNGRVQEFDEHDAFVRDWPAPDLGYYGPRDVAVAPDDTVYVLDQGHSRIVRLPATGPATTFGELGEGPGQLNDPTGLAVAGDLVYVADSGNDRIQVFGADGRFIRSVGVGEWSTPGGYPDVAVSPDGRVLYASSPTTNEVLVFTIDGRRTGSLKPVGADALAGPGALAVRPDGRILAIDFDGSRVSELAPPP